MPITSSRKIVGVNPSLAENRTMLKKMALLYRWMDQGEKASDNGNLIPHQGIKQASKSQKLCYPLQRRIRRIQLRHRANSNLKIGTH